MEFTILNTFHFNNKFVLIEFQGIQHYEPVDYYGGIEGFLKRQINDEIKRRYCKKNNINLLEIKYDQIKNIPRLIQKHISEIQ